VTQLTYPSFKGITRLSLVMPPFAIRTSKETLEYISLLSKRLEVLHLRRKIGLAFDEKIRPHFWQGVLDLTFPKLESFAIEDQAHRQKYELNATRFWERHPELGFVEMQLGHKSAPVFPPRDKHAADSETATLLPKLRHLTVCSVILL
jgi:hypothetical protein